MAFKIGNQTVIQDIDASALIETNSDLDKLQINSTDVLVHDGSTITLKNVEFDNSININTDDLTEGSTNLFHTTARVQAIIDTNTAGFITVDNDQQTLTFSSPNLSISNGNSVDLSSLSTNLSGYATETYVDTAEVDAVTTANAYTDQAEVDAKAYTDTRETAITTAYQTYADLAEADAKAYTDTRETAITTAYESYANAGDTTTYNASKSYTDTEIATVLPLSGGTLTGALTLDGAPTGSNNAATKAYVDSSISSGTGALDTDDIPEASNLYYTDARVNTLLGTKNYATEAYADQVEVDAKAYTDTRETAITTAYQTYADQAEVDAKAYTDTAVAGVVDSAPATLDTLNELAAALGDDPNLSTTLSTQIGTKLATADFNSTADAWLGSNLYYTDERVDDRVSNLLVAGSNITLTYNDSLNTMTIASATTASGGYDLSSNTTDDVTEGASNLYFTSARVDTIFNGKTTSDLTEGTNLYYTDARVDARIPTNVSSFTNDSGYLTSVGTISYNDLSNKPTIPTNNNQLTNGAGYITSFTDTNTTYTAGNGLTLTGTEFTMSGSYTGSFTASGDVTAYSDERLKSNIITIEDALSKVNAMRGVMFDKTDSLSGELKASTGVIAQEVEEVLPEVVHDDSNTGYKSVAYGNIVGVLIEAIKEQQLQIDKLTEQVEFLKGKR